MVYYGQPMFWTMRCVDFCVLLFSSFLFNHSPAQCGTRLLSPDRFGSQTTSRVNGGPFLSEQRTVDGSLLGPSMGEIWYSKLERYWKTNTKNPLDGTSTLDHFRYKTHNQMGLPKHRAPQIRWLTSSQSYSFICFLLYLRYPVSINPLVNDHYPVS